MRSFSCILFIVFSWASALNAAVAGLTPTQQLWQAIEENSIKGIEQSLKDGAYIEGFYVSESDDRLESASDSYKAAMTPLRYAVARGKTDIASLLINRGANVYATVAGTSVMFEAIVQGDLTIYNELKRRGVPNLFTIPEAFQAGSDLTFKLSPLYFAAASGNLPLFEDMLVSGYTLPGDKQAQQELLLFSVGGKDADADIFKFLRERKIGGDTLDEALLDRVLTQAMESHADSVIAYLISKNLINENSRQSLIDTALRGGLYRALDLMLKDMPDDVRRSYLISKISEYDIQVETKGQFDWFTKYGLTGVLQNRLYTVVDELVKQGDLAGLKTMTRQVFADKAPEKIYLGHILHASVYENKPQIRDWIMGFAKIDTEIGFYQKPPVLWWAIEQNDIVLAKSLLSKGASGDIASDSGMDSRDLMDLVCEKNAAELVPDLVKAGAKLINEAKTYSVRYIPPVACAVQHHYTELVAALLKHGANPDQEFKFQGDGNYQWLTTNLLLYAIDKHYNDLVNILLQNKASTKLNIGYEEVDMVQIALVKQNAEALDMLLSADKKYPVNNRVTFSYDTTLTPVEFAFIQGDSALEQVLIQHGATKIEKSAEKMAGYACQSTTVKQLGYFLANGVKGDFTCDEIPYIAQVIIEDDIEKLELLARHGAGMNSVFYVNEQYLTPLLLAVQGGKLEMVKKLVSLGASINLRINGEHDDYIASMNRQSQYSLPLIEAVRANNTEIFSYLIESGADVNFSTQTGHTALMAAAETNNLPFAIMLLAYGARPDAVDVFNDTALSIASAEGHVDMLTVLQSKATSRDKATALLQAATEGKIAVVSQLISETKFEPAVLEKAFYLVVESGNSMIVNNDFTMPEAELNDRLGIMRNLLDQGISANTPSLDQGPLHVMFRNSYVDDVNFKYIDFLVKSGANINQKSKQGVTPLHLATEYSRCTMVQKLLRSGADPQIKSDEGKTAFDYAQNAEISAILTNKDGVSCD